MDGKVKEDERLNYNFQVYLDNWVVNGAFIKIRNTEIGAEFEGENDNFFLYIFIMGIKENETT